MSSLLRHGIAWLRAPANELAFAARAAVRWSRGVPDPAPGEAVADGSSPPGAGPFAQRYDLAGLAGLPTVLQRSNLARLAQLERLLGGRRLPVGDDGALRAADFGCGDFHYAPALQQWLQRGDGGDRERRVVLRGIELDAYGVYRDGHSRADHARARARAAGRDGSTVRFEVGDAAAVRLPDQDVVTLFFPFLTAFACLAWGVPLSRLRPRRLLQNAVRSLRPGGLLVVANQTAHEHLRLCRLLRGMPVVRIARCTFATELAPDPARTSGQIGSLWLRQEGVPSGTIRW